MPPICEIEAHVTKCKSSHCELQRGAENSGYTSPPLKETSNTITSEQTQKLAYNSNDEVKSLKTKEPQSDEKQTASVEHSAVSRALSPESKHDDSKGFNKNSDVCIDKTKQEHLYQRQFELQLPQHFQLDAEDETADGHSDTKATPKVEVPTELESAHVHENNENVQGVTKCTEDDDKSKSTSTEEDSGDEDDKKDEDNPSEETDEPAAPKEADMPVQTQSDHTSRKNSEVPIVEATECTSPVGKEKLETQIEGQIKPSYLHMVEDKNSDLLPDHTLTDLVSVDATSPSSNKIPLDDLPKEEQTQNVNNLTELVVNQSSKHPEDEMETGSFNGAITFLTVENVEKLQTNTSEMYPYFPALNGSAGELTPMESSYDSLELHTQDDDDVITLEGSVSDYTSFKSGSADAFDPDV